MAKTLRKPVPVAKPAQKKAPVLAANRRAQQVTSALAVQRGKVRLLQNRVRSERNLVTKILLARDLRNELLKLQLMVWAAKGDKRANRKMDVIKLPPPTSQRPRTGLETYATVRQITATAKVPERASTTTAPASTTVADTSIPADPAALTDTDVEKVLVDAEAAEATIAATGDVPAAAETVVVETAEKPAEVAVAEAGQGGGFSLNWKTAALGGLAAAVLYLLVRQK